MSWTDWVVEKAAELGLPIEENVTFEELIARFSAAEQALVSEREALLEAAALRSLTWEEYLNFEVARRNLGVTSRLLIDAMVEEGAARSDLPTPGFIAPLPERVKERLVYLQEYQAQVALDLAAADLDDALPETGSTAFGAIRMGAYMSPGRLPRETVGQLGGGVAVVGQIGAVLAGLITLGVIAYFLRDLVRPEVATHQAISEENIASAQAARQIAEAYYDAILAAMEAGLDPATVPTPSDIGVPDMTRGRDVSPLFGPGGLTGLVTTVGVIAVGLGLTYVATKALVAYGK